MNDMKSKKEDPMGSDAKTKKPAKPPAPAETENIDEVEEASRESFPASDAPGWISENPKKKAKGEKKQR